MADIKTNPSSHFSNPSARVSASVQSGKTTVYPDAISAAESGNALPASISGLAERFADVARQLGQDKSVGATGRSWKSLLRYMDGFDPPASVLIALAQAASVHINWLATGEGPRDSSQNVLQIERGTQREQLGVPAVIYTDPSAIADDAMVLIPLLDVQPSAGSGTIVDAEAIIGRIAFDAGWLRSRNITPQAAHVLTARGDSMEPTIRSGDTLIVDTAITEVVDNGIYVVAYGEALLVKRLKRKFDGSILITSDNQLAGLDETVPAHQLDALRIAGRVMWFGRII